MSAKVTHAQTVGSKEEAPNAGSARPRVVLIEDNPLTVWAIERTLAAAYELVRCSTLEEAQAELARADAPIVICGSPIVNDNPDAVRRLADVKGRRVIALVSDPDCRISSQVHVLEKPFVLSRLADLLADSGESGALTATSVACESQAQTSSAGDRSGEGTAVATLVERLTTRFEREICPICVNRTADEGCSLTLNRECPVFEWARQLAEAVAGVESNRLSDYMDRIQAIICPTCMARPDGKCEARDHLDCPLDLYLGLVVPIIEDELKRTK